MQPPEHLESTLGFIKIVILGNKAVGKTSLYFQWFRRKFDENRTKGTSLEHFPEKKYVKDNQSGSVNSITLHIWDTGFINDISDDNQHILEGANLFIVVVDACDNVDEQLKQIKRWCDYINLNLVKLNSADYKIIIVQNKIDLPQAKLLNSANLRNASEKIGYLIAVSCKNRVNFSVLDNMIASVVQKKYFPGRNNDAILLYSHKESFDQVSEAINMLTHGQADYLLNYLDSILKRGITRDINKPYQLCIFGGGENFVYHDLKNDFGDSVSRINGTFPLHLVPILTAIQERTKTPKELLIDIYQTMLSISEYEPFSRRNSTHQFYAVILPGYLKKSANEISLAIDDVIAQLKPNQAIILIDQLKTKLLNGPCLNIERPYISNIGSENYKYGDVSIKLPRHVFWMVQKIDDYFDRLQSATHPQILQLKSNHVLYELRHDLFLAELTFNSARHPSTQDFYAHELQNFIVDELVKINSNLSWIKRSVVNLSI